MPARATPRRPRGDGRAVLAGLQPAPPDGAQPAAGLRGADAGRYRAVHEAFFRFVDTSRLDFHDRQHFFAVAGRAMRQIAVDHARRRRLAAKRDGGLVHTTDPDGHAIRETPVDEVLAIDEALAPLADTSPRLVEVVELCFFAGLTTDDAGEALGVTGRTVKREWLKARMLLQSLLRDRHRPP